MSMMNAMKAYEKKQTAPKSIMALDGLMTAA